MLFKCIMCGFEKDLPPHIAKKRKFCSRQCFYKYPKSDEQRKKMSKASKNKKKTKKHCENISKGRIGIEPWNKDIPCTDETKSKISKGNTGKKRTEKQNKKQSERMTGRYTGENNSMYGVESPMKNKNHKEDSKQIMREKAIIRMQTLKGVACPNYNPNACIIFDKLNEDFGINLIHAENGGEVQVIGYFLDAYDKKLNLAIEFDENLHNNQKYKEKDKIRQGNIVKELNCEFLRIRENMTWDEIRNIIELKLKEIK